jgi:hypothetical protein
MIKPDKYTNLNLSLVNIGGVVLKSLCNCTIQKYEDLENHVTSVLGENSKLLFVPALSFLYAIGKSSVKRLTDKVSNGGEISLFFKMEN